MSRQDALSLAGAATASVLLWLVLGTQQALPSEHRGRKEADHRLERKVEGPEDDPVQDDHSPGLQRSGATEKHATEDELLAQGGREGE